ncbi:hypothetical protein F511_13712 [Dorcoceras hygrometricum]|uniref:Uncharacterized protein n=1 Tax=Dorcoceras hygrometricum TaxID=472368 RepID=A0A2Z7B5R3_9LAMI|nr:hypothetical protein F511_13712 [Dorcoceras hygrometricum]
MEERERSLLDEKNGLLCNGNDIKDTIQDHENISHTKDDSAPDLAEFTRNSLPTPDDDDPLPVSSQPAIQPATYVVQVPKDQIYRVPPPEHALMLAERHANQKKQKGSYCFSCQPCCSFFPLGRWRRKESAPTQRPDGNST